MPALIGEIAAQHPEAERIELWFEDEARIGLDRLAQRVGFGLGWGCLRGRNVGCLGVGFKHGEGGAP